jgi:hypothetical protein
MNFIKKYGEWLVRLILILGICANLWLTQSFVTRSEFEILQKDNQQQHLVIQTSINDIAITLKLLANNALRLDDHEARIRIVEKNQIDVMARLRIHETSK